MNKHEAFAAWAPDDSPWSVWAKPVLFAHMPEGIEMSAATPSLLLGADAFDPPPASAQAMTILDLPGADAVTVSMLMARRGHRPVPLYNAVPAAPNASDQEVVKVRPIMIALQAAAPELARLNIPADAPPVFLLDAHRRAGMPGDFDNRSISLPTDFPSASFLTGRGINEIHLIQRDTLTPQADLAHTLLRYQDAGLHILSRTIIGDGAPQPIAIARPAWYRFSFHRLLAVLGLRRSPLGGFGGTLPEPSAG